MPYPDADGHRRRGRFPWGSITLPGLVALVVTVNGVCVAEPVNHKARRSVPATVARSAPDTTGAIPTAIQPPPTDTDVLPPPFTLPKASRARMRACGHQWEAMKQAGATGDDIWRDFATKCLAAKDDPVIKADGSGDPDGGAPASSR